MERFKIGDVVRLVSGSPRLTVVGVTVDKTVIVGWIGYGTHVPHKLEVPPECLKLDGNNNGR